ncbi:MAG: phosphatidylserine decarboxylase [Thermoplasmatota archaeon]|nr:phosphatidylserine decarboxylase [Halobacteriales archaeon]
MPRFARGALPWLVAPLLATVALAAAAALLGGLAGIVLYVLAGVAAFVFLFFLQFFRDPDRPVAAGVASPADGKVVRIDQVDDADLGRVERLAIFMSPKDVHVNRFPLDGTVVSVRHVPGGHIPAFDKDAHTNERVETILDTELGRVKVIQIAGTVARRIVPYISGGETARKGDRFGLIRLGSRCDLLVAPGTVAWSVGLGTQVYGGKTSIGTSVAPPRSARATAKRPKGGKK